MIPLFIKSLKPKRPDKPKPTQSDLTHFSHLLAILATHQAGGDFGEHNVKTGHHVAFAAGAFTGAGKVTATGRDGVTVEDNKCREHRVHWREVTGHFVPEKADKASTTKAKRQHAG